MTRSPETVESEVEARRANVEETLDALRAKMSLGQIIDELSGYVNGAETRRMVDNAGRQIRDNPMALGLIGAGLAWLAAGDGVRARTADLHDAWADDDPVDPFDTSRHYGTAPVAGTAANGGDDGPGLGEKAGALGRSVSESASEAGRRISDRAADGRDRVTARMERESARAREATRTARRTGSRYARSARQGFAQALEEQPLVLGALAMAVGTAVGAALPGTETEDELLGEHRDRLRDEARDMVEERGRDALDAAERAYDAAKAEAADALETGDGTDADQSSASAAPNADKGHGSASAKPDATAERTTHA